VIGFSGFIDKLFTNLFSMRIKKTELWKRIKKKLSIKSHEFFYHFLVKNVNSNIEENERLPYHLLLINLSH